MASLQELERALVGAHNAGDTDAARRLAVAVTEERKRIAESGSASQIPAYIGPDGKPVTVAQAQAQAPSAAPAQEPTLGQKAVGAGEALLTLGTGATGGTLGMIGGTLKGLAEQILSGNFGTAEAANLVEQSAQKGAQALTYAPRTQSGQEQVQAVGEIAQDLIPAVGIAPQIAPMASVRAAAPARVSAQTVAEQAARAVAGERGVSAVAGAVSTAERVADMARTGATTLPRRALESLRKPAPTATPGTLGSAGAAATDMARQRIATAEQLPVPIQLTRGQATRDPAQLKFEVETSKMPEEGAALRQRIVQQNTQSLQNFDSMLDKTGAEAPSLRAVGMSVDRALVDQAKRDKDKVRAMYKEAEKAGELETPVSLASVVQHLNEAAPEAATAPLLNVARARALQTGIAVEQNGQRVPPGVPLKKAEMFRQSINRATDFEPTNVRQATIIKALVDESTDGLGGTLYKQARKERARYAQNYENRAIISNLLAQKRGSQDRRVAFEDVFDQAILKGSLDDVRNVRRVLQRSGPEGDQAWRELQGASLNWIKERASRSTTDSAGNSVISADGIQKAIRELDADGRLEFIFSKNGAQQLRDLSDLAQYVKTIPPEAGVNYSNTAATMLAAFGDVVLSGSTGVPAPIATATRLAVRNIKDRKLRARVQKALTPEGQMQ